MGKRRIRRDLWDLWCGLTQRYQELDEDLADTMHKLEKARREASLWTRNTDQANARYDKLKKAHTQQVAMIGALYKVAVVISSFSYEPPEEPSHYCLVENETVLALRRMADQAIKMVDIGQGHNIER